MKAFLKVKIQIIMDRISECKARSIELNLKNTQNVDDKKKSLRNQ